MLSLAAFVLAMPQSGMQSPPPSTFSEFYRETVTVSVAGTTTSTSNTTETEVQATLVFPILPQAYGPQTPYSFTVGNWTLQGKFGDDATYKKGARTVSLKQEDELNQGIFAVRNSLTLELGKSTITARLNGYPQEGPSVVADTFTQITNSFSTGRIVATLTVGRTTKKVAIPVSVRKSEESSGTPSLTILKRRIVVDTLTNPWSRK